MSAASKIVYVGGLDGAVEIDLLFNAFAVFGDVTNVYFPLVSDASDGQQRNFAFVEFEDAEDAKAAIDNMHLSELMGRVIKVNWARTASVATQSQTAVWENSISASVVEAGHSSAV